MLRVIIGFISAEFLALLVSTALAGETFEETLTVWAWINAIALALLLTAGALLGLEYAFTGTWWF